MTRLDRVIKGFNDYDNLVNKYIKDNTFTVDGIEIFNDTETLDELHKIRSEVSMLIGELKRFGCRRERREKR